MCESYTYVRGCARLTTHIDPRGNTTTNQYDGNGNLSNTLHRDGSEDDFEYDLAFFGLMTAHTLPSNGTSRRRDEFQYHQTGSQRGYLHRRIVDAPGFALTTEYEYDAVGNIVRVIDPLGNDTLFEVNQFNQITRTLSRDLGAGLRYERLRFYDANDNLVRVDV